MNTGAFDKKSPNVPCAVFAVLGILFAAGFAALAGSLYRIQIYETGKFNYDKSRQSIRRLREPGMRGRIVDMNGDVLAESRPSLCIVCYADELKKRGDWSNTVNAVDEAVDRISACIMKPREVTRNSIDKHIRQSRAIPLVVWKDLDIETFSRFAEHSQMFPGFAEDVRQKRIYPGGSFAAHLIGNVKSDRPAKEDGDDAAHFFLPELRGDSGLEAVYDSYLVGVAGKRCIRVNASGLKQSEWESIPARPGPDLQITLDASVQLALEEALEGRVGAGVVVNPATGAIMALASSPSYNPNSYRSDFSKLLADPDKPLLNRAIYGQYTPGSIFKPITALAALSKGVNPDGFVNCPGVFTMGDLKLHCWNRWGHGDVNMTDALRTSCNTYFCEIAGLLGQGAIVDGARAFGLGAKTGIDLTGEASGLVPTPEWKMKFRHERWYPGDTVQMSIGQGMLLVTPLQMAVMCGALANGGDVMQPFLKSGTAPRKIRRIPYAAEDINYVRNAMREVVETGTGKNVKTRRDQDGTAYGLPVSCAAKTGTAEVGYGSQKRKNAWIIAFAPFENPTVALAIVVEHGEGGAKTAAPMAHNVLAAIFGEDEGSQTPEGGGI